MKKGELDEEMIEKEVDLICDDIQGSKIESTAINVGLTLSDLMKRVANELEARGD